MFKLIAANTAINNLFRDIQIKLLGTSETFLGHTSDLFDNIQDALMPPDENGQSKPSELKKALRFLKTEARRRREDLEDEIEIEKEKAEEEAAKRRKEEEAKKRKKKKRHSNRRNSVKKRKAPAVDSAKNKTTAVLALEKEKKNSTKSFKLPINKTAELTTIQPYIVGSLGDGFGRHM